MKRINRCQLIKDLPLLIGLGVLLFLMVWPALAQTPVNPTEDMLTGNQSYEAGRYAEAIEMYEKIIATGVADSILYYNLGNAYFKHGDLGRAILNYRRAQRLNPRDTDIAANLAVARAQTVDQLEITAEGSLTNLIQVAENWLTLYEASSLALFLWILLSFLAIVAILSERLRRFSLWGVAVLGLLLVIGLISMANRFYTERTYPPAVVVIPEVDVTSGPGSTEQYLVEFNLHTGAEVDLLESRPGWRRVALPGNDFQGWVPDEAIEQVIKE